MCAFDLSCARAGPWTTQILADRGVDVIKVERPGTGDDTRGWGPPWVGHAGDPAQRVAAWHLCANRNKRSITMDIATPEGQDGPYAPRAGYDFLVQGLGGLMSITGRMASPAGGRSRWAWR